MMGILDHAYAIIMAGGKGERFWPLSTEKRPKQLLALAGGKPLIVQAVERLNGLIPPERVLIVTNRSLVKPIRDLLGEGSPVGVLGEPVGRDTAAAIAAGAAWIQRRDPDAAFCVLTADHIIGDLPVFRETLSKSLQLCSTEDVLMTIGIKPSEPSSAYGYIEVGSLWQNAAHPAYFHAVRFVEKPDIETAQAYLDSGQYVWNSGMFVWSLKSIFKAFASFCPQLSQKMAAWTDCRTDESFLENLEADFPNLDKISIDYAVMEKAENIIVCRGSFSWDDVGSWPALDSHLSHDQLENARSGNVAVLDSRKNIVVSEGRLTALIGVENLVVVQADGVTLICDKNRSQDIKKMVSQLRDQGGHDQIL